MAIGDAYITRADLKTYMSLTTTDHDTDIDNAIASASAEVERLCHRQFNKDPAPAARTFTPTRLAKVIIDDFYTVSGLIVKTDTDNDGVYETTWASGDYDLEPQNGVMQGVTGWPFWRVAATGRNALSFPCGYRSVQVTASWGWNAVPQPVKQACFILAADNFQLKDQRLGVAGSDQFGTIIRVADNRSVMRKLRPYARDSALGA